MRYIRWLEYESDQERFDPLLTERNLKVPKKPEMSKDRCLSILVSSHFLNIPTLFAEASVVVKD